MIASSSPGETGAERNISITKKSDRVRIDTQIIRIQRHAGAVDGDHVRSTDSLIAVDIQTRDRTIDTENLALAILAVADIRARCTVVVEEAVQTQSVHGNSRAVDDAQTQRVAVPWQTATKVRVRPGRPGDGLIGPGRRIGLGLVVWRFGLEISANNVGRTVELELVQSVMLRASSPPANH